MRNDNGPAGHVDRPRGSLWRLRCRTVALGSALAVVAHVWMAVTMRHSGFLALAMAVMALTCLPCTVALWRGGRAGALRMLIGASAAMAVVHLAIVTGQPGHAHGGHSHAASTGADLHPDAGAAAMSMLLLVVLELCVAYAAAHLLRSLQGQPALARP